MGFVVSEGLFENRCGHLYGVAFHDDRGKRVGVSLKPGDEIVLTEDQQREVARAPRDPADNPFVNGTLVLVAEGDGLDDKRPIGTQTQEVVGTPVSVPQVKPEGSSVGELTGTHTGESLELLKRDELNVIAVGLGVKDAAELQNKKLVIEAILAAQG